MLTSYIKSPVNENKTVSVTISVISASHGSLLITVKIINVETTRLNVTKSYVSDIHDQKNLTFRFNRR